MTVTLPPVLSGYYKLMELNLTVVIYSSPLVAGFDAKPTLFLVSLGVSSTLSASVSLVSSRLTTVEFFMDANTKSVFPELTVKNQFGLSISPVTVVDPSYNFWRQSGYMTFEEA